MQVKKAIRNIAITISIPLVMFILMLTITRSNGVEFYGKKEMWRTIITNLGMAVTMGCALAMQLRSGRFDFSGGANMVLAGILGCYYTQQLGGGAYMMLLLCVVFAVILSLITATVYIVTKLPIIINTIMMALIYEALTLVLAEGNGVNIINTTSLNFLGRIPYTIYIMIFAMIFYQIIISLTTFGKKSNLLRNGQAISVNIGINEKKNVLISYLISGVLYGLAATIFVSQNRAEPLTNLSSTGILFSYIASVYIGMFLGKLSLEIVGILVGALTIQLMNYGLKALGYGSGGWNSVFFGIFMMLFWVTNSKATQIEASFQKLFKSDKKKPKIN